MHRGDGGPLPEGIVMTSHVTMRLRAAAAASLAAVGLVLAAPPGGAAQTGDVTVRHLGRLRRR